MAQDAQVFEARAEIVEDSGAVEHQQKLIKEKYGFLAQVIALLEAVRSRVRPVHRVEVRLELL